MPNLFLSTDIDHIALIDYAAFFLDPANDDFDSIQLPPIQRNSVWNVGQIERLWDSLLRGFPIGSFYLSERKADSVARSVLAGTQVRYTNNGYFLLDGQQRTRAILLGFEPSESARLYIDADPRLPFVNPDDNDRKFIFRLLTNYQPWGMNKENPAKKLSEGEKQNARKSLKDTDLHYDYQLSINYERKYENYCLSETGSPWPVQSQLPIPFDVLIEACGGYSGNFSEPDWNRLMDFVPDQYASRRKPEPTAHFREIVNGLRLLLSSGVQRQRNISVLLLTEEKGTNLTDQTDPLEILFTRVNAGGTRLEGEEMAYSLLKSSWDDAYNLVSQIITDDKIGYLFTPTRLVMAASRLAALRAGKNDDPKPNVRKFRQWIADKSSGEESLFLRELKNMMITDHLQNSRFTRILSIFCKLALYREEIAADAGLPRKLLLHLRGTLIHPVLIWIDRQLNADTDFECSRPGVLRYLFYALVGFEDPDKASKNAVGVITSSSGPLFPDIKIYEACLENETGKLVPRGEEFLVSSESATGFFRSWDELFGDEDDEYRPFRSSFWHKKELLLWFQRAGIPRWFPGYNPMSEDAADTPYDYDHILPASHVFGQGATNWLPDASPEQAARFRERRGRYLGSIGNFRIWPLWANRSDGNICPAEKLRMESGDLTDDVVAMQLKFNSEQDFTTASVIHADQRNNWSDCKGNPAKWPAERRIAWQKAVEERAKYLYLLFYNTFQFEVWVTAVPDFAKSETEVPVSD